MRRQKAAIQHVSRLFSFVYPFSGVRAGEVVRLAGASSVRQRPLRASTFLGGKLGASQTVNEVLTMTTETFPLPDFGDDGPVVLHDDFRQTMLDAGQCYLAVGAVMSLLRGDSPDMLDPMDRQGLAVLLESVHNRLELVVDGLRDAAGQLGVAVAGEVGL